jgi:hypothetical protein
VPRRHSGIHERLAVGARRRPDFFQFYEPTVRSSLVNKTNFLLLSRARAPCRHCQLKREALLRWKMLLRRRAHARPLRALQRSTADPSRARKKRRRSSRREGNTYHSSHLSRPPAKLGFWRGFREHRICASVATRAPERSENEAKSQDRRASPPDAILRGNNGAGPRGVELSLTATRRATSNTKNRSLRSMRTLSLLLPHGAAEHGRSCSHPSDAPRDRGPQRRTRRPQRPPRAAEGITPLRARDECDAASRLTQNCEMKLHACAGFQLDD